MLKSEASWPLARRCVGPGRPYACLAEEMPRSNGSGVLYLDLDAGMLPCAMAKLIDVDRVGSYSAPQFRRYEDLELCYRKKPWWATKTQIDI